MSGFDVQSVVVEILASEAPRTSSVLSGEEVLVAQRPPGDPPLSAAGVFTEVLCLDAPVTHVPVVLEEVVAAEREAQESPFMTIQVMREVLAFEGIQLAQGVRREVLASVPDDPLTVHGLWTHFSMGVLQQREYLFPPLYISEESVGTFVQLVTQIQPSLPPWSPTRVTRVAQLAAMSRGQAYTPIAAIRVPQLRVLAAQAYTPPALVGFPQVRSLTSMAAVSFIRPIPPTANWVGGLRQLAAQERLYGLPEGDRYVGSTVELVAMLRVTEPPFTQALVAGLAQLAAAARAMPVAFGMIEAAQAAQLAAQERPLVAPFGAVEAGQYAQLAALGLELEVAESYRDVGSAAQLAALQLVLPPPSAVTGVNYGAGTQLAAQERATTLPGDVRSPIEVGQAVVQYALGRTTVPPDEVENPEIGCHVNQVTRLAAQFRAYPPPPPPEDGALRLRSLSDLVVLGDDGFPAPPFPPEIVYAQVNLLWQTAALRDTSFPPQSFLQVPAIEQRIALGDDYAYIDPLDPKSTIRLTKLAASIALGDESLPPGDAPQSDARVQASAQFVTMGDTSLPPANVPLTQVRVTAGTEWVVLADQSLPAGPQSVAKVGQVGQHCALRDESVVGLDEVSQISCASIGQSVVLRDRSLGVPLGRRARPVASITITL